MRKKAIGLLLIVTVGFAFAPTERAEDRWEQYVNEKHGCSLYYRPAQWNLRVQSGSGSETAIFMAQDDPEVMAVLNMFDPVPNLTLHPRQLFDMDRGALATIFGGLTIQEERVLTLSGATAHQVTFEGREKRVTRYTIVHRGSVYLLVYIAPKSKYASYLPGFRAMVETFRIFGTGVPEADPRTLSPEVVAEPAGERALRIRTQPDPVFVEIREGDQNWHYHLILANPHDSEVELREIRVRYVSEGRVVDETRLDPPAIQRVMEGGSNRLPPKGEVRWRDHAGHRERAPESIEYAIFFRAEDRLWQQTHRVSLLRYQQKTRFTLPFNGVWRVWRGHEVFEGHRQRADAQAFAYDFIYERGGSDRRPPEARARARAARRARPTRDGVAWSLADFYAFGRKVLAPADGRVVRAVDGEPDRPPVATRLRRAQPSGEDPRQIFGNYIVIDHGHGEFSVLAHLKRGSVRVKRGDHVKRGQVLAECGNSGASPQPHLHFHVMDGPDPMRSRGLPVRFENYRLWRGGRVTLVRSGVLRAGERVERVIEPTRRAPTRRPARPARSRRRAGLFPWNDSVGNPAVVNVPSAVRPVTSGGAG
ncbi:MAG: M23 family metallopeptidase [Blastocatellia bacterium]|nr:M23 family metallopeptidase [Blastocatellia bacterium]MCS7158265.1 M23 family metallopeptidase [Blastocatellia bacterium]MCX7753103.1 M23 family metallopeptidase [Blastocatellia bacterium]MDW8169417.1 M23 family metallopeptidase [Acidobacteriota bacterium]MDW8255692.1 M23 family metallopeptidase [Acidobacteriota bacterium]